MSEAPLKRWLTPPDAEAALPQMWPAVAQGRRRPSRASAWAAAGMLVGLAAGWGLRGSEAPPPSISSLSSIPAVVTVPADAVVPRVVRDDDGNEIVLSPGARLTRLETKDGLRFALEAGRAGFVVAPRGDRGPFVVEAADVAVTVVGTRFSVARVGADVTVEVESGRVAVQRGATRATLGAGERWPPAAPAPPAAAAGVGDSDSEVAVVEAPPSPSRAARKPAAASRPPTKPAAPKVAAPPPARSSVPPMGVEARLAAADDARAAGRPEEAARHLREVLQAHATDERAPLAAVMLGRLERDRGRPAEAAQALAWALAHGVPPGLAESVRAGLVEAHATAGDRAAARQAAQDYLRHHPEGRRRAAVQAWAR